MKGYDKKLMSDHHYEIQAEKRYKLTLEIRSVHKMIIHIGIACYDKHKNIIHPIQVQQFILRFVEKNSHLLLLKELMETKYT